MKTKILSLLAIAAMTLGTTSCHEDITPGNGSVSEQQGSVNLRSMGVEINNAEKVIVSSRSTVDLSDFIIDIVDSDGAIYKTWTYSDMPELFSLPVGDYKVKVRNHDVAKAAWEDPYFVGEQSFSIANDEISEIGVVTCSLSNVKVTIDFSDDLKALMGDDCKVTVYINDEGSLEYTKDETRAGYFAVVEGSTTLVAEFTGTVDGYAERMTFTATDVAAGQWRKITFKIKDNNIAAPEETGSISITGGINIDLTYETSSLNGNVTVDEDVLPDTDRPGKEDPVTPDEPGDNNSGDNSGDNSGETETANITYVSDDLSFDAVNSVDVSSAVVYINAVNGIEHLVVTISSTDSGFIESLPGVGLPTTFDLAYPGDAGDGLSSIGLPVGDEVIGKTSVKFDITDLVPLLKIYSGTHKFQLSTTDTKGEQLVKTLTFLAE